MIRPKAASTVDALVIGAGPAGLMAAQVLAASGRRPLLAEAMPTPARKFLMAGKSGLNLTKDEPPAAFRAAFGADWLAPCLQAFGPPEVMAWARDLGQEVFTGSSGRVFPTAMKASPLLRAWLGRLAGAGVALRTRWRWTALAEGCLGFATPEGTQWIRPRVTVLALGGASWSRLGSDGAWTGILGPAGVALAPFRPANMGFRIAWSAHMAPHLGRPVKNVALIAGDQRVLAEFTLSAGGVEGGGIYAVAAAVRDGARLRLDLLPGATVAEVAARLAAGVRTDTQTNRLRKTLHLDPVKIALLREWLRPLPADPLPLARSLKDLHVPHLGPRPLDQAISTAGGIMATALTPDLQLRALPGVFACGEMLDWEAPTGGYLLTGCLATGRWAGLAAAALRG